MSGQYTKAVGKEDDLDAALERIRRLESELSELRAERQAFHQLMELIPDSIYFKDLDRQFTRINRAGADFLGVASPRDALGKTDADYFDQAHVSRSTGMEKRIIETGVPVIDQLEEDRHKDGRSRWVSATEVPLRDEDGRVVGLLGISRDTTARKRAVDFIYQKDMEKHYILSNLPDFVVGLDRDGRILFANHIASGLRTDDVIGVPFTNFVPEEYRETLRQSLEAAIVSGEVQHYETRGQGEDGSMRWYSSRIAPVPNPAGPYCAVMIATDTTSRVDAVQALRTSERLVSNVLENVPDVVAQLDTDGDVEYINRNPGGRRPKAKRGTHVTAVFAEESWPAVESALQRTIAHRCITPFLATAETPDGAVVDYAGRFAPLDPDHSGDAVLMIAEDITGQRVAERALEESEERYRTLVENLNDVIFTVDLNGHFTYVSPAIERHTSFSAETLRNHAFRDFVHPDDLPGLERSLGDLVAGKHNPFEFRVRDSGDDIRYVRTSSRLIYRDGKPVGITGIMTDITEQKLAEGRLLESETRFRQLLDNVAHVSVQGYGVNGIVHYWNRASEIIYGYTAEEAIGQDFVELIVPPEDREWVRNSIATAVETGQLPPDGEMLLMHKDGTRVPVFSSHIVLSRFNGDREFYCVDVDLRKMKDAEEDRVKMEAQVQQAQKLESLGVLAGGIAHDFNNLLVGILGNADLALADVPRDTSVHKSLTEIEKASRRAADLCRQMLAYSGRGKFIIERIVLNHLVEEMAHLLEVSISKKVRLVFDLSKDIPLIEGDATQIRQIVMNLITNASEAIGGERGEVHIATGTRDCSKNYLDRMFINEGLAPGKHAFIEITDNGVGMTRETVDRIFDPFYSTKFTGRGLGLAAVLGIVRGHKGALRVESAVGKGTTFTVLLPTSAGKVSRLTMPEDSLIMNRCDGTILLVDDEDAVRMVGSRMLEKAGFDVITADNGVDAIAAYRRRVADVACVILDHSMPDFDGFETYQQLREINPDVRVVLSSGFSEAEVREKFDVGDLAGYLQKPYRAVQLIGKLREVIGKANGNAKG